MYILGASVLTIGLFISTSAAIASIVWYVLSRIKENKNILLEQKTIMLTDDQCMQELSEYRRKKGIVVCNISKSQGHIIKPESPEQSPTYFYYEIVEDDFSNEYYLTYINKKNLEKGIERRSLRFTDTDIKIILENASESNREYVPVTKQIINPATGETTFAKTYERSPIQKVVKKEEVIGD